MTFEELTKAETGCLDCMLYQNNSPPAHTHLNYKEKGKGRLGFYLETS